MVVVAAAALVVSGCWPAPFTYRPGVTGAVIAADDGTPVVGASIRLIVPREDLVPTLEFTTGSEGTFAVEPHYSWGIRTIFGESWSPQGIVEITATGFVPHTQQVRWSRPSVQHIGTIRLTSLR